MSVTLFEGFRNDVGKVSGRFLEPKKHNIQETYTEPSKPHSNMYKLVFFGEL